MGKRGNREGCIFQLPDGKWRGAVSLGDDESGRPLRKWVQRKTRREVVAAINNFVQRKEKNQPIHSTKRTVERFMQEWLEMHVAPNLAPLTHRAYEQATRDHILPTLGKISLEMLNGQDVQRCLNKALKDGLSPTTVKGINRTLKTALSTAKKWRLVDRNVAKDATPPRQIKYEAAFLLVEQAEKLLKVIKGHRYGATIVIALMLGLRSGEVAALRWSNVDLIERKLYVYEQVQRLAGKGVVLSPVKTKQSRRAIPIPQICIDALIERQKIQQQEKIAAGAQWVQDSDFVFTSLYGRRIEAGMPWRVLKVALDDAELPHIRFHDLRHTTASILLAKGVPMKVVSEILGHAGIQITMDLYSHLMPNALSGATALMNDVFKTEKEKLVVAPVVAPVETTTIQ